MRERNWFGLVGSLLTICLASFSSCVPARAGTRWGADYFPNVSLLTHDGRKVRFYDDLLKDKIVVIDLIYTHCKDSCPLETARLAQVQKLLGERVGRDIFFYSISIDPKADTPEVLKAYADKFHAGPGWTFLTGKQDDIDLISKKLGLYSPDWGRDGHRSDLMIGNVPAGLWMRNSAVDNPKFLALTINNLLGRWYSPSTAPAKSYAEAVPIPLKGGGHYLFVTRCVACHTIGQGDHVGPDLLEVTHLRERVWLRRFIKTPETVLDEKDPIAMALFKKFNEIQMPNLRLGDEDVDALIAYIEAETLAHKQRTSETTKKHTSKNDTGGGENN